MKILIRTLIVIVTVVVLAIAGLFIYLSDERLKELVLPQANEALGREIQLDRISFTLFRTFPNFGLAMSGLSVPDDEGNTIASLDELLVSLRLMPLLKGNVEVTRLDIIRAELAYVVFPDGTTNMDFLFANEDPIEEPESTSTIDLNRIRVIDSNIRYLDYESDIQAEFHNMDMSMSIRLANTIQTDVDATIGALYVTQKGTKLLNGLGFRLIQTSDLDMENENLSISEGILNIRGLELDLTGVISGWSNEFVHVDLALASKSDNFGSLLELIPEEYKTELEGFDTRGKLQLEAKIQGLVGEDQIPEFNLVLAIQDGYLKHPNAAEAIEDIQVNLVADKSRVELSSFKAKANTSTIDLRGHINEPLSDTPDFDMNGVIYLDLGTVETFYPVSEQGIELRGKLDVKADVRGVLSDLENAQFNADVMLTDGYLRHKDSAKPVEDITLDSRLTATEFQIRRATLRVGTNTFEGDGRIRNYLKPVPELDVKFKAAVNLGEIEDFYSLEEMMIALSGQANMDIALRGPIDDFSKIRFNGGVQVTNVSVFGDSLPAPITGLNGNMTFSDMDVQLRSFTMQMGSSDYALEGRLVDWRNLFDPPGSVPPATLNATYRANKLNIDEYVNWEEENTDPLVVELPNLKSQLVAQIDTMIVMGIPITKIAGQGETDPKFLRIRSATATMFGGAATGRFDWEIYEPRYTFMHFIGRLENVEAQNFFKEFQMGGKSKLSEYITGRFKTEVDYKSGVDALFNQDAPTIIANGNFGIDRATLKGHPTQNVIADLLRSPELKDLSLDNWTALFTIKDGILTLTDMNLTSRDIGFVMNGSQNLIDDQLNYKVRLRLPERYGDRLARILTADAVMALKQPDGIIILPLVLVGTSEQPRVSLDTEIIQSMVTEYLRKRGTEQVEDAARRILRGIRGN